MTAEPREVGFELERFGWTAPGRLEVVGRWSGAEGRKLGRPVLTLEVRGQRRRLTALPGEHPAPSEGGEWRAAFAFEGEPADVTAAELEIGRRLVVDLPRPRRRRTRSAESDRLREELAELRAEVAELRAADERPRRASGARQELERLREAHAALETEHAALTERAAESDSARELLMAELAEVRGAHAEREGLAGELAAARDQALVAGQEAERRLAAERAASTEVREEAQRTIEAKAEETERLRTELEEEREASERLRETERAEVARLREELAARPGQRNGDDDGGEAETAARRMYERIAHELERERATARDLRRELDAIQAQTAEHRRVASSAAANGITTEEAPVAAATPAGRVAAARRIDVSRVTAHHRARAAREAAAHRVPAHRSAVGVWGARAAAFALVAALLLALVLIVSAVA